jgi:hypothetical protein
MEILGIIKTAVPAFIAIKDVLDNRKEIEILKKENQALKKKLSIISILFILLIIAFIIILILLLKK